LHRAGATRAARGALAVAVSIAALAGAAPRAEAQLSPGPLSRAHASLEGNKRCFDCHGAGEKSMTGQCLSCHAEIARPAAAGRGLHAREGRGDCAACHPEHAGTDFALVSWGKEGRDWFDHRRSGWPLEGAHAALRCEKCHTAAFQDSTAFAGVARHDFSRSHLGLATRCKSCHKDPHAGRLGATCESCHNAARWQQIAEEAFDHSKTRYPLRGAHAQVKCEQCHDPKTAWGARPVFAACSSCHEDAHAGQTTLAGATVDCADCHDVTAFRPSTYTVARHRSSAYPLEGKHTAVACDRCHTRVAEGDSRFGTARARLRLTHAACRDCHAEAHGTQLAKRADRGACESCHGLAGWTPSTFDARAHADAGAPLEGRHADARCAACHGPERRDLPPMATDDVVGAARVALSLGAITECASCHQDPHAGRYARRERGAAECRSCHGADSFRLTRVDAALHARLGAPLNEAHAAVACPFCHEELRKPDAQSTLLLAGLLPALKFEAHRTKCADCHEDPHRAQFAARDGGSCERCHGEAAFHPAPRFDHDRDARFALAGAHAKIPCVKCHPTKSDERGAYTLYRPVAAECSACHGDGDSARRAQSGAGGKLP